MLETDNPYLSPRFPTLRPLDEDRAWRDGIQVEQATAAGLLRRIVFQAPLEMELEYRGYIFAPDAVRVDGQLAAAETASQYLEMFFSTVKSFRFEMRSGGRIVPVQVEARWSWHWPTLNGFRVQIEGQTVYSDGIW